MSETTPARANHDGHPCPPWCATDHDEHVGRSRFTLTFHASETPVIHTPSGYVHATAYQVGYGGHAPQIALTSLAAPGALMVDVCDAGKLAALAEQLADATPDQHRELAAAIRKAAADITEAGTDDGRAHAEADTPGLIGLRCSRRSDDPRTPPPRR